MLSRLALRRIQALPATIPRTSQVMSSSTTADEDYKKTIPWGRPVRQEPGKVRFGFVPDEWFTFFYPKTGVTGPYMFGISVGTYLLSKEWYILEHEFYTGCTLALVLTYATIKFGPSLAEYLDKLSVEQEAELNKSREDEIKSYEDCIASAKKEIWRTEIQAMITEAKKENIKMQLEAEYRARLANVYNEVKKRLDFQVQKNNVERQFEQKHMVQWIVDNVKAALTPEVEKTTMQMCIKDLQNLAATAKV